VKKTKQAHTARDILAANLRRERLAKGWSQMELADEAELHFTYISAVECRKRNVSIDAMERLAKALGMELWELLRKR
jgi:transcriptional regulator with XRE-family HTH domain